MVTPFSNYIIIWGLILLKLEYHYIDQSKKHYFILKSWPFFQYYWYAPISHNFILLINIIKSCSSISSHYIATYFIHSPISFIFVSSVYLFSLLLPNYQSCFKDSCIFAFGSAIDSCWWQLLFDGITNLFSNHTPATACTISNFNYYIFLGIWTPTPHISFIIKFLYNYKNNTDSLVCCYLIGIDTQQIKPHKCNQSLAWGFDFWMSLINAALASLTSVIFPISAIHSSNLGHLLKSKLTKYKNWIS